MGLLLAAFAAQLTGAPGASGQDCLPVPETGLIEQPGRFCLTGDLKVARPKGIDIASGNVELDLRTFELVNASDPAAGLTIGIRISGTSANRDIKVHNGRIRGFVMGLQSQGPGDVVIENLEIRDSGAVAIHAESDGASIRNNRIESVSGQSLDPNQAYAVGVNLAGKNTVLQDNAITNVDRQKMPRDYPGEAVGVLIRSDCEGCVVQGNRIVNERRNDGSIGIWSAALGQTEISNNSIRLFERGVFSAGRLYVIRDNTMVCGSEYQESIGIMLVLRHPTGADAFGASFNNKVESCLITTFQCFSDCDSKVRDLVSRLGMGQDKRAPGQRQ
jgi:hypothetical protein